MSEPIARRVFDLELPGGDHTKATVTFFKPEPSPDEEGYRCAFLVENFFDSDRLLYAWGIDSLGALTMALARAQASLWALNEQHLGTLTRDGTTELAIFPLQLDDDPQD